MLPSVGLYIIERFYVSKYCGLQRLSRDTIMHFSHKYHISTVFLWPFTHFYCKYWVKLGSVGTNISLSVIATDSQNGLPEDPLFKRTEIILTRNDCIFFCNTLNCLLFLQTRGRPQVVWYRRNRAIGIRNIYGWVFTVSVWRLADVESKSWLWMIHHMPADKRTA